MLANLPWGENAFQYYRENEKIIQNLGNELQVGCQCAFVVNSAESEQICAMLASSGFKVSDSISISNIAGMKLLDRGKQRDSDSGYFSKSSQVILFCER